MPVTIQANRTLEITTTLGPDKVLINSASISEHLGRLFQIEVDLTSDDPEVSFDDIVGQNVTLRLDLIETGETRYFNGFVSKFVQTHADETGASYRATLVPWLWFLTRTADCQMFQKMTIPDIVKKVFRDNGFTDFQDKLTGNYTPWEYCVQYRETDFNFVSRLMEHEGIYYFFQHEEGKHTLVLADSISAHEPYSGYEEIEFRQDDTGIRGKEHITSWVIEQEVQPGKYALNDFNFEKPKTLLLGKSEKPRQHAQSDFEIFDYPGEYEEQSHGNDYSKIRIEELHAQHDVIHGQSNARGIAVGHTFDFKESPREDQEKKYLITSASYHLASDEYHSGAGGGGGGDLYSCSFTAIDASEPFRAARITPKPLIQGPQTAMVVGPKGEEIYTDQYGRIKVQFHWDRYGKSDENSSCWIRFSQPGWAGKAWGAISIPRIGQEVIVEFLEGDPDLPIVTGRVYNADTTVPYALPANKTQTGFKSRSTLGGGSDNFNEFRFEDKKGSEQVYLHAEKNQDIEVENDETHWVGHDRTKTIDHDETTHVKHDRTETVDHDETITIGNNRTEQVVVDESITVGSNRTRNVGQNETITVALMRVHTVGVDEAITIGAAQEITVGGAQTISVGLDQANTIGVNRQSQIGKDDSLSVGKNHAVDVGKALAITAGDSITLTTGDASIIMKKDGTIQIKGKDISIRGSGKIGVHADGDVVIKGSKVAAN